MSKTELRLNRTAPWVEYWKREGLNCKTATVDWRVLSLTGLDAFRAIDLRSDGRERLGGQAATECWRTAASLALCSKNSAEKR